MTKKIKSEKLNFVWPTNKFLNKFWIYNLIETIGIAMLILSIACRSVFTGPEASGKVIGNIVASCLLIVISIALGTTYSILFVKKQTEPYAKYEANRARKYFWVPILGMVFAFIWKHKEKYLQWRVQLVNDFKAPKPKIKFPNSISIIFIFLVSSVFVIWILYVSGVLKPDPTKGQIIPGILDIFLNPLRGFAGYTNKAGEFIPGQAGIIIFLLVFAGCMELVNQSKAIECGVGALLRRTRGKEILLIPALMIFLAICGSTFNMCEELLPLFLLSISIFYAAGYDRMTGFLVVFMSAGVGVMGSTVNPSIISVAISSIPSGVPTPHFMDGFVWRLIGFIVLTVGSIICTMLYARKVRNNPAKSCVYMSQKEFDKTYSFDQSLPPRMDSKRKWTLIVFGLTFLLLIFGLVSWEELIPGFNGFSWFSNWLRTYFPFLSSAPAIGSWGTVEITMLFFIAAIVIGVINWKGSANWFRIFYTGARGFVGVAFIIAVSKGLAITLTDSGFDELIARGLKGVMGQNPILVVLLLFIVVGALAILIPSSSGLASAFFPVVSAPIAAAGRLSLSGAITVFSHATGWANLFTPAGMILPSLEVSKMNLRQFLNTTWKQILVILGLSLVILMTGTTVSNKLF